MQLYHPLVAPSAPDQPPRWLMLIHQLPAKPAYLRVKVGRRLAAVGAVALKNTVYVLPRSESAREDFQWVLREVTAAGGDATLLDAQLVDGLSDVDVEALFCAARDVDYAELADEARAIEPRFASSATGDDLRRQLESELARLERRLQEIVSIDFFGAPARESTRGLLLALRARIVPVAQAPAARAHRLREYERRTWVTRAGIHIDRIASAWLIRRFIDEQASFKFVPSKGYVPEPGELRFDMFEAEFTHEGERCTFEVLCARFELTAPGLRAIAELVHDIDLKDAKFARAEAAGLAAQVAGLAQLHRDDVARLAHGSALFEQLLAYFSRRRV